jgi:hypothetical protein
MLSKSRGNLAIIHYNEVASYLRSNTSNIDMLDLFRPKFQEGRQLRYVVWLLIAWQLVCVVAGTVLPAMTSRLPDVECDCPIEIPAEESESESESPKNEELFALRRCSVPRKAGSGLVHACAIFKQFTCFCARSHFHSSSWNGFRACRLC